MQLFIKALAFAAEKHKGQFKKDNPENPYINHPVRVVEILADTANIQDETILSAAILHDILEKTNTTEKELDNNFGSEISGIVKELSDPDDLSLKEKQEHQIQNFHELSSTAKLIKLADKTDNLNSLILYPKPGISLEEKIEYQNWIERSSIKLKGINQNLDQLFDETLAKSKKIILL